MKARFLNESEIFRGLEKNDSLLKFVRGKRWAGFTDFDTTLSDDFSRRKAIHPYFSILTDGKQGLWFQPTEDSIVMLISAPSMGEYRNEIHFMKTDMNEKIQVWKKVFRINTETHKIGTNQSKKLSNMARSFMKKLSNLTDDREIFFVMKAEYRKPGWGGFVS